MANAPHGFDTQYKTLQHYEIHRNLTLTGEEFGIGRATLSRWKAKGWPTEITGGRNWDDYLKEKDERAIEKSKERAAVNQNSEMAEFLEEQKKDVKEMLKVLGERLKSGAGVKISYSDYDKLLLTLFRLDNQAADRLAWQRTFIRDVVRALVSRVSNPSEVELVKLDIMAAVEKSISRLGVVPNAGALPSPSDQLPTASELQASFDVQEAEYEDVSQSASGES